MTPEDEQRIQELALLIRAEKDAERLKTLVFELECLLMARLRPFLENILRRSTTIRPCDRDEYPST
jgi:hypothetical protein